MRRPIRARIAAPIAVAVALSALTVGCLGRSVIEPTQPGTLCRPAARTMSMVISRFGFVRQDPAMPRIADGFDVDGRVSDSSDPQGCRRDDFTSSDGTPGVDNQLALLLPLVDQMTGGALDGAIQAAINNGQLLVTITIDDLDNRCNDDHIGITFQRVAGMPSVGADMRIDPGQTFDLQRSEATSRVDGRVREGFVEAGPFSLAIPIAVLDARFTLNFYAARFRARLLDDGGLDGIVGGGVSREEFSVHVHSFNIPMALMSTIDGALQLFADLAPDARGRCAQVSGAMRLDGRPAFVNP